MVGRVAVIGFTDFTAHKLITAVLSALCATLCAAWVNISDPAARCETFTLYGSGAPATLSGMCYAHVSPAWFPYPVQYSYATSGRMRWPCRGASDCSLNGACDADGGC